MTSSTSPLPLLPFMSAFLVLSFAAGAGAQLAPPKPATPEPPKGALRFKVNELDFGKIRDEKPVDGAFRFTNRSEKPVKILSVTSTCGCTVVSFEKKPYEPGAEGEIKVQYNPAGRQGKEKKAVTIETDDAELPKFSVYVLAEVIPRIGIEPRALWLGEFKRGVGSDPKTVTVTTMVKDFEIKTAGSTDARFEFKQLSHEPAVVDGEEGTKDVYEVRFKGDPEVCILQSQAVLETNDAKMPKLQIPLVGRVVGELRLSPDMINLRLEKPGETFTQPIQVGSRSNKPFKILSTHVTGREDMHMQILEEGLDPRIPHTYKLMLKGTVPMVDARGGNTFQGVVTLKTDIAEQPEATIPISGFVMLPPAAPPAISSTPAAAPAAPPAHGLPPK